MRRAGSREISPGCPSWLALVDRPLAFSAEAWHWRGWHQGQGRLAGSAINVTIEDLLAKHAH
jgi:hypothetical protein